MQLVEGREIYSASDLNDFLECRHLTELERLRLRGEAPPKPDKRETALLLARKGDEHEAQFLERLQSQGSVCVLEPAARNTIAELEAAEAQTIAAMERGERIIYQAAFFDGTFSGRADFLQRIEEPSRRWAWSYEVADTKLARNTKPYFLIQLCNYSGHVARIQGNFPRNGHIVLGNHELKSFRLQDYLAYYRRLKNSFLAYRGTSYPTECAHCTICDWAPLCEAKRDSDDHLSLVAGIRRDQIRKFEEHGIQTLTELARAATDRKPRGMQPSTFQTLQSQAKQQQRHRETRGNGNGAQHFYEFRTDGDERSGFAKLPQPDEGDVFFDLEGDPLYSSERGLEYLWGYFLALEGRYEAFWATEPSLEKKAFEDFINFIVERRKKYPRMHVYHYASYEPSTLKRLMGRFGSCENEIDELLRGEVFVDLYPIVRQSMFLSQPSYGIKKVEAFYKLERKTQTRGGDDSIVMFERWRVSKDAALLEDIRAYNEDDCRSTYELRKWLLERRDEFNAALPDPIPWRPEPKEREAPPDQISEQERKLLEGLPAPDSVAELRSWTDEPRARWLLGNLMRYHRREQLPEWWEYYHRVDNAGDLEEYDRRAIGGLTLMKDIVPTRTGKDKNYTYAYSFRPQEYRLDFKPHCPDARKDAGEIVDLDEQNHQLKIKLSGKIDPERLRALIPGTPPRIDKKRKALEHIADLYLEERLEKEAPALMQMLLLQPPQLSGIDGGIQPEIVSAQSVSQRIAALNRSHLFVQGPPGSGKSTIAASCILDLIANGKRVAVTANSHKAVHNLLHMVEAQALERNMHFGGFHKSSGMTEGSEYESRLDDPMIFSGDVAAALNADDCMLASGTTHAFADENLRMQFDYIFIDEAGQISLADALLVALVARSVVLFGDPLQLPQVTKGSHPVGASSSILEHLLGGAQTIPPDRGIFLDVSYRLHPAICDFISQAIYEGRLRAAPECASNVACYDGSSYSGLRYVPAEHDGCSQWSLEEAQAIVEQARRVLTGTISIGTSPGRPAVQGDIMVVTPYNYQRTIIERELREAGLENIRVGTVDKFQGQQASVIFYSLAASSGDTIPRGTAFLFDRNRFNVAISRAQCLSVLVCSPRLLEVSCTSAEQLALANLLCAFAEAAGKQAEALKGAPV